MKNKKQGRVKKIELDPETVADLEVDDHGSDHIKGGRTQMATCKCAGTDGGGSSVMQ